MASLRNGTLSFIDSDSAGGIALALTALAAVVIANPGSPLAAVLGVALLLIPTPRPREDAAATYRSPSY